MSQALPLPLLPHQDLSIIPLPLLFWECGTPPTLAHQSLSDEAHPLSLRPDNSLLLGNGYHSETSALERTSVAIIVGPMWDWTAYLIFVCRILIPAPETHRLSLCTNEYPLRVRNRGKKSKYLSEFVSLSNKGPGHLNFLISNLNRMLIMF